MRRHARRHRRGGGGDRRALARREGILGGFSTGANVAAALRLASTAPAGAVVATIACDTGLRYLSTDLYE